MRRVLLVFRGPISAERLSRRLQSASEEEGQLALCYELPLGGDGFHDALQAQRELTLTLRQVWGDRAEDVAVFAVTNRDGDRVADYAREWGATIVCS